MKKFYLAAALLGLVYSASPAQSKLSMGDRVILHELRMPQSLLGAESIKAARTMSVESVASVGALVEIATGYNEDDLVAAGAELNSVIGEFATVTVPLDKVEEFAANPAVGRIQLDRAVDLKNDVARKSVNVHRIHAKYQLTQAYTGEGVIAGAYDVGLDPHHPAFKTDDKSASRVHRLYHVTDNNNGGTNVKIYSGTGETETASGAAIESLDLFSTDNVSDTHGTHTIATVAGGKGGSSTFYGMAPDADIVMACGSQSLNALANGISAVAEYGVEVGKPVVINCSMGTNAGSHDGTDVFARMMDRIVEKTNAIICFSAGNEGDEPIAWHHKFDKSATLTTAMHETKTSGVFAGLMELYGNSAEPFKVTISIGDIQTGKIIEELVTIDKSTDGEFTYFGTSDYADFYDGLKTNATINKYWSSGCYGIASSVNADNGRYCVMVRPSFGGTTAELKNSGFRYVPVFTVEGSAGQEIWGYCSGSYIDLASRGVAEWTPGITNGSISNLACSNSVISVGAYVSRNKYTATDGSLLGNNNVVGSICDFSSYGDIADGRSLPEVCAPGSFLISAISYPYWNSPANVTSDGKSKRYTRDNSAQYEIVDGRVNAYCQMQGTSMSCPVTTGSIVLWKQANPDLTLADVRSIIKQTAIPVTSDEPTKWGAGKLDALAGIKKAIELSNTGIDALNPDVRMMVTPKGDIFEVYVNGETALNAVLYNMSGVAVLQASASGDTLQLDASSLTTGVYVLSVEGSMSHCSQRVLVK